MFFGGWERRGPAFGTVLQNLEFRHFLEAKNSQMNIQTWTQAFNAIQPCMYLIARKTNMMMFWLNARIFSTIPLFLAISFGQSE